MDAGGRWSAISSRPMSCCSGHREAARNATAHPDARCARHMRRRDSSWSAGDPGVREVGGGVQGAPTRGRSDGTGRPGRVALDQPRRFGPRSRACTRASGCVTSNTESRSLSSRPPSGVSRVETGGVHRVASSRFGRARRISSSVRAHNAERRSITVARCWRDNGSWLRSPAPEDYAAWACESSARAPHNASGWQTSARRIISLLN